MVGLGDVHRKTWATRTVRWQFPLWSPLIRSTCTQQYSPPLLYGLYAISLSSFSRIKPSTTRFNFLKVTLYTLSLGEMTYTCLSPVQTSKPQAHIVNCITAMSSPLGCPRLLDQEVQAQSEVQHPLKHGTTERHFILGICHRLSIIKSPWLCLNISNLSFFFYLCHRCSRPNPHNLSPRLMQKPPNCPH